jgi:hypothetical protein
MSIGLWWINNYDRRKPNSTWNSFASTLGIYSNRPMSNHLIHGTAHIDNTLADVSGHVL